VDEKGISNETADEIGNLVKTRGTPLEVLMELRKEGSKFMNNEGSVAALNELEILFKALDKANAIDKIVFDLSLARGLDYYTGVIYEAVFKGAAQVRNNYLSLHMDVQVNSSVLWIFLKHIVIILQLNT
jgi:histidyl-tRNA synthetase